MENRPTTPNDEHWDLERWDEEIRRDPELRQQIADVLRDPEKFKAFMDEHLAELVRDGEAVVWTEPDGTRMMRVVRPA